MLGVRREHGGCVCCRRQAHGPCRRLHFLVVAVTILVGAAGASPEPRDREAPSAPENVRVVAATPTLVHMAWDASVDNVGVVGYYVTGDKGQTGWREKDSGRSHRRQARVHRSRAGMRRERSHHRCCVRRLPESIEKADATVSTAACPDTQPPSPPSGFTQVATSENAVVLAWTPSADNVGVVEYGVYRDLQRVDDAAGAERRDQRTVVWLDVRRTRSTLQMPQATALRSRPSTYGRQPAPLHRPPTRRRRPPGRSAPTNMSGARSRGQGTCAMERTERSRPRAPSRAASCAPTVSSATRFVVRPSAVRRARHRRPCRLHRPPTRHDRLDVCANGYQGARSRGRRTCATARTGTFTAPRTLSDGVCCINGVFGDPLRGATKRCETRAARRLRRRPLHRPPTRRRPPRHRASPPRT